ncbi:MAG: diguanylate cyclase domain-containing protein, partial [Burkholderiaceae bacterium]
DWNGRQFAVGASIGVAPFGDRTRDIATILHAADSACYAAKDGGRNRIHVFTPAGIAGIPT